MRTTIDIDEDILRTAKDIARDRDQSLGRVISDLVREGLRPRHDSFEIRDGIVTLKRQPDAKPVTSEHVKELLESEDY